MDFFYKILFRDLIKNLFIFYLFLCVPRFLYNFFTIEIVCEYSIQYNNQYFAVTALILTYDIARSYIH